jgi:arsenite methyltransferase
MEMKDEEMKKLVREGYAKVARSEKSCCGQESSCCRTRDAAQDIGRAIGYSEEELETVPEGSNLGLGCGNPLALASLKEGDVVLDLGSGAGFDCFLAAKKVGKGGKVIGVDMTPEMIDKARQNAKKSHVENVEFRLGEIENIPVADGSVDVVISNCVINLSPKKGTVFKEALRVLKPGGRLILSDIVLTRELPDFIRNSVAAYVGCISGAVMKGEYVDAVRRAGFQEVRVVEERSFPIEYLANDPTIKAITNKMSAEGKDLRRIGNSVLSIKLEGRKANP